MNSGSPTEMYYPQHMSAGQPQQPQTVTSGPMSHYPPAQPPLLQPGQNYSNGAPSPYQYGYTNGMTSPSGGPVPASLPANVPANLPSNQPVLPLPGVASQGPMPTHYSFDTTGQHPPPGMKPRVTATLWEDEGSLCFQVEARGICVARREDNHMINGTKLLNVAGMTRGRRDGILKSEKVRHVVKIGPMHLKGVWIPYERALDFANKEKITELLYPLFVHNIGALLYHPTNQTRTSQVMAAAERRKQEQGQQMRTPPAGLPSIQHPPPAALPSIQHQHQPQQEHDTEYTHYSAAYENARPSYNSGYGTSPRVQQPQGFYNGVGADRPVTNGASNGDGSPHQPPTSGRATPRTAAQPQPYYYQHNSGYAASPRVQQPPGFYNGVGTDRPVTNGTSNGDVYAPPPDMANPMPNGYAPQPPVPNGTVGVKRGRDDDDLSGPVPGMDKRRKTLESSTPL